MRVLGAVLGTVGGLIIGVSSAYGATLSVSSPQQAQVDQVVTVTTAGSTEQSSAVWTYYERGGVNCAATQGDHSARVNTRNIDLRFPDAGSFTFNGQFQPFEAGSYRLCAYLYYLGDNEDTDVPRAVASAVVEIAPPPPPPDRDGDGKPDAADTCPDVAAGTSDGCPPPPDSDGDGKLDPNDRCPAVASATFDGCPADDDRDGRVTAADACPTLAGTGPTGCPPAMAPTVSAKRSARLGAGRFRVRASCAHACRVTVVMRVAGKRATAGPTQSDASGALVVVGLSRASRDAVRRALKRSRSLRATFTVEAVFADGSRKTTTHVMTLRR